MVLRRIAMQILPRREQGPNVPMAPARPATAIFPIGAAVLLIFVTALMLWLTSVAATNSRCDSSSAKIIPLQRVTLNPQGRHPP
jgi:hypothetical protein